MPGWLNLLFITGLVGAVCNSKQRGDRKREDAVNQPNLLKKVSGDALAPRFINKLIDHIVLH